MTMACDFYICSFSLYQSFFWLPLWDVYWSEAAESLGRKRDRYNIVRVWIREKQSVRRWLPSQAL